MSKLHIASKADPKFQLAAGDGEIAADFSVSITEGTVVANRTYYVRQGQSAHWTHCTCTTGATRGGAAKFREIAASALALTNSDDIDSAYELQSALAASQKSVVIQIDTTDLDELKKAGYMLCFAKKVGDADFNVVWQSYTKYLVRNTFRWTPQYQLFGTNVFEDAVQVEASTNLVTIGLGEESVLSESGVLGAAKTGGPAGSINMKNDYGSIHPGVNQLATGIDGSVTSTPIYVAPKAMVSGEATLTPVERILVWFEQNIQTSTMFSDARSRSVEIDLTGVESATRLYKGQKWSTP